MKAVKVNSKRRRAVILSQSLATPMIDADNIFVATVPLIIIIIINVKINVALSENASRTRYTIKIKLKLRK